MSAIAILLLRSGEILPVQATRRKMGLAGRLPLIRKCCESKEEIEVRGTGKASREFLYVDDGGKAILLVAEKYGTRNIIRPCAPILPACGGIVAPAYARPFEPSTALESRPAE